MHLRCGTSGDKNKKATHTSGTDYLAIAAEVCSPATWGSAAHAAVSEELTCARARARRGGARSSQRATSRRACTTRSTCDGEARLRQAREVIHGARHHSAEDPAPRVPRGRPRLDPGGRRVGLDTRPAPRAASAEDRDGHRARGRGYAVIGARYRELLARQGLDVQLRPTAGDVENLALLRIRARA